MILTLKEAEEIEKKLWFTSQCLTKDTENGKIAPR